MAIPFPAKHHPLIHTDLNLVATATMESDVMDVGTTANWLNVTSWRSEISAGKIKNPTERAAYTSISQFDLEIACDASETLNTVSLWAVRRLPQVLANDNVDTVDDTNDELDIASHAYKTGDGPVRLTTSGTLPGGLAASTDYWIIVVNSGSIALATSLANAVAGTKINITSGGTGTHTIVDVVSSPNADNDTQRLHFYLVGELNAGEDIVVGEQSGYMERVNHSPLTLYYSVVATETSAQTITLRATPVQSVEW